MIYSKNPICPEINTYCIKKIYTLFIVSFKKIQCVLTFYVFLCVLAGGKGIHRSLTGKRKKEDNIGREYKAKVRICMSMCLYAWVYICVSMSMCVYAWVYVWAWVCVCMHEYVCRSMCVCMHEYVCVCMSIRVTLYVCVHASRMRIFCGCSKFRRFDSWWDHSCESRKSGGNK